MSYATLEDLETRLGPEAYVGLTDDEGTGTANTVRAREALDAAQAEIDSFLAGRYAVPVRTTAELQTAALLKALTLDLAEYRLHARQPPTPEEIREKAVAARQWLRDLAHGRAWLPLSKPALERDADGIVAASSGGERIFRRNEQTEG